MRAAMSTKSPRYIPPESLVEITARTVGARFLMRPSPALNAAILAILGRALSLFPVTLHAFAFMSNHWHALITPVDARAVSQFLQHVHSNIARTANRLHDWSGPVIRRASTAIVADDAAEARLHYILSQGAKEGLVASPLDWPGVHCARALAGREVLRGVWRDRSQESRLRTAKGGRQALAAELETTYPIELAPIRMWSHLSEDERRDRVQRMIREIEREARRQHPRPLGALSVCQADPTARPDESKRSKAPFIHTASAENRRRFHTLRTIFELEYRAAACAVREQRPARIPSNCFPPHPPFARTSLLWMAPTQNEDPEHEPRADIGRSSGFGPQSQSSSSEQRPPPSSLAQAPPVQPSPSRPPFS